MVNLPFKELSAALTQSSDWVSLQRAWQETESLTEALSRKLPADLMRQVVQVRRSDPAKGIRGSQLTVVASTSAAAAKLRMALADWDLELKAHGWGISEVKVTPKRAQEIPTPVRVVPNRDPIPSSAKTALQSMAQEVPEGPLKKALQRIARKA